MSGALNTIQEKPPAIAHNGQIASNSIAPTPNPSIEEAKALVEDKNLELAKQLAEDITKPEEKNSEFGKYFHLRSDLEKSFLKFVGGEKVKKSLYGFNVLTLFVNFGTSILSVLPIAENIKDFAYKASAIATKTALAVISGFSGSKRLVGNRNILLGAGQAADPTVNTWAWDFVDLFLGRGFSYGATILGIGLNRASGKEDFKNWSDCLKSWLPGLKKLIDDAQTGFFKNYFNAKSGLMSFANGIAMISASTIGFMSSEKSTARKVAATVRTGAGLLQDIERCLTRARPLYFKSGLCHVVESIFALLPKYYPDSKIIKIFFTSLGMGFGNLGRIFFAESQDKGEISKTEGKTIFEELKEFFGLKHKTQDHSKEEALA